METKKVIIDGYIFNLYFDEGKSMPTSGNWKMAGIELPENMTEEQLRIGERLFEQIFQGIWNWLIFKPNHINLPVGEIQIELEDREWKDGVVRWNGGTITSKLKEICSHCNDPKCEFDCEAALEWASDRDSDICNDKNKELEESRRYNMTIDAIESMILGHACAGVNVESVAYIEGLQTALDAIDNNI